ncbi:MAG: carbohydrate ABC transporter permease [Spirochaetes bacterium]|nr:MAG: carbohydrate ABC transporter permease [Spirochaetota bacterium]
MLISSVKHPLDVFEFPFRWIPRRLHFYNYIQAIAGNDGNYYFIRLTFNSLFVAGSIMCLNVLVASAAGYGLTKFRFRGRQVIFVLILATMMIPFETIMIPLLMLTIRLRIQDSYMGLIFPVMLTAFAVFLMRQSILTVPDDYIDSARIDGAGELRIFFSIIFPTVKPTAVTLAILVFRESWDNLIWPLIVVQSQKYKTLPLYIISFLDEKYTNEAALMAVAVLATIPIFMLFFAFSRYFIGEGILTGAKG